MALLLLLGGAARAFPQRAHIWRPGALRAVASRPREPLATTTTTNRERYEDRMLRRSDNWRRQLGLCLVCGQPVAAPQYRLAMDGRLLEEEDTAALDTDGRLLTEECPVRMSLLRFNALGEFQAAHVVDDYTLLEARRSGTSFRAEFKKREALVLAAHPAAFALFKQQVLGDTPEAAHTYASAAALGKRVVAELTVGTCKRCNKAMDRVGSHATAVYRCFSVTRDSDVPALEGTDKKAIMAKKVLQQIALFFVPVYYHQPPAAPAAETTAARAGKRATATTRRRVVEWRAKSEAELLADAALWRCVAHLSNWGAAPLGSGVRFRLIALFHASHYIYLTASSLRTVDFAVWHTHIWRPFYMERFAASTFLGLHQTEVAHLVDLSQKDGARWEKLLRGRLAAVGDEVETFVAADDMLLRRIADFEDALAASAIIDEAAMLRFLARSAPPAGAYGAGVKAPKRSTIIAQLLAFFRYNLSGGSGAPFLMRQCDALERDVARAMGARAPPPTAPAVPQRDAWFAFSA